MDGGNIVEMAIDSSSIKAFAYSAEDLVLWVQFQSGSVYRYTAVPRSVVEQMLAADSKGRFFAQHVRTNYHFAEERVASFKDIVSSLQPSSPWCFPMALRGMEHLQIWSRPAC